MPKTIAMQGFSAVRLSSLIATRPEYLTPLAFTFSWAFPYFRMAFCMG
jgi:hypothetical protein